MVQILKRLIEENSKLLYRIILKIINHSKFTVSVKIWILTESVSLNLNLVWISTMLDMEIKWKDKEFDLK